MPKRYSVRTFPRTRAGIIATTSRARKRNNVHGLIELDVTEARRFVKAQRRQGRLSFKAFLIKAIADTAHEFPAVHSMRKGRRHYLFEDVDVAAVFEQQLEGESLAVPAVIRAAQKLDFFQLTAELEELRHRQASESNMVLGKPVTSFFTRLFLYMPGFLQRFLFNLLLADPVRAHRTMGSVMVTNLTPFATLNAWGIPLTMHPLTFLLGSVVEKAVVRNGEITSRQIMNVTITVDHDVIDGAQISRFIRRLARRVESPEQYSIPANNDSK